MDSLLVAHSHMRWLVFLFGLAGLLGLLYNCYRQTGPAAPTKLFNILFIATLDIQFIFGMIQLFHRVIEGIPFRHSHPVLMLAALAVAHIFSYKAKKMEGHPAARTQLIGYLGSITLILLGIYI